MVQADGSTESARSEHHSEELHGRRFLDNYDDWLRKRVIHVVFTNCHTSVHFFFSNLLAK